MRNIDREFSLIRTDRRVVPSGRLWNPAADVYRSSEGWVVKVDLAGVCSDELEIEIRDRCSVFVAVDATHIIAKVSFTSRWKLPTAVLKSRSSFPRRSKARR